MGHYQLMLYVIYIMLLLAMTVYDDWNTKASDTYQQDLYERSSQCDSSHSEPLSIGESTCCHGSSHTFISLCQHNDDDHDGVDHDDNDHDDDDKW